MRTRAFAILAFAAGCHVNDYWAAPDARRPDGHAAGSADASHDGLPPDVGGPAGGGCIPSPVSHDTGLRPSAPTAIELMWPSVQERFHRDDGTTCTGQVTVAANDRVVCYVGVDDDLHCAGAIYTHTYGPGFVGLGYYGVDQILLWPTFNSATGNAICVHDRAGTAHCMGDANNFGAFGNGTTGPTAQFVPWSSLATITRIGGSLDKRCALDAAGEVYCAGYGIGATATREDTGGGHRSFWITSTGELRIDDPTVLRAVNASPCEVQPGGLTCAAPGAPAVIGAPGDVVDGLLTEPPGGLAMGDPAGCWLDRAGRVVCVGTNTMEQRYACAPPMLAVAGSLYTSTQCAVANDGSLWCRGNNDHGELGTTMTPVLDDTMVQPPGSVKIVCQ